MNHTRTFALVAPTLTLAPLPASSASQLTISAVATATSSANVVSIVLLFLIIGIVVGSSLIFLAMRKISRGVSKRK